MATLQFKPDELLKKMRIRKYAVDQLISEGKGGSPNTPTPDWDKNWPKPGTGPKPEDRPTIPTKLASRDGLKIASGGDADASMMNYVTVGGFFLDGSGKAYMQTEGKLYDAGEYNPDVHGLPVPLAEMQARNGMKIAMSPADVPLGDGMINNAKTKMQTNLKQKYDMMLENGMMSQEEYDKVMKRTMGTKKK